MASSASRALREKIKRLCARVAHKRGAIMGWAWRKRHVSRKKIYHLQTLRIEMTNRNCAPRIRKEEKSNINQSERKNNR